MTEGEQKDSAEIASAQHEETGLQMSEDDLMLWATHMMWPASGESARAHFDANPADGPPPPLQQPVPLTEGQWERMKAGFEADAEQSIRAAMSAMDDGAWPDLGDCIPKGSILHLIDEAFVQTTDIPRELPVFAAIHYISALLLQRGVVISVVGEEWRPDIWTETPQCLEEVV